MHASQECDVNALIAGPVPNRAAPTARALRGGWPLNLRVLFITAAAAALWTAIYAVARYII